MASALWHSAPPYGTRTQSKYTAVSKQLLRGLLFKTFNDTTFAAREHRDAEGNLVLAEMMQLHCKCTFRSFEPLEEYRHMCPRILIICCGEHAHPIPLPTKTPPSIQTELVDLLESLDQDLPDLTTRRFLRHSVTTAYLRKRLPAINNQNLADLHISLANRDHVKTYIIQVQKHCFPFGTGWRGNLLSRIM
jgi:hypothetical protein